MISKTQVTRETARRIRRAQVRIGDEVRRLRLDAGVSLRDLGSATGLDPSHLARIEKATAHASFNALTSISVALGADVSLKFFAGAGPRIHDRFQAPMIEALLRALADRWLPRLEVPSRARSAGSRTSSSATGTARCVSSGKRNPSSDGWSNNCAGSPRKRMRSRPARMRVRYRAC